MDVVAPVSRTIVLDVKFDRKIFSLQVSPVLPSHIILINYDGSISLVSDDLKHVACTCEPPTRYPSESLLYP